MEATTPRARSSWSLFAVGLTLGMLAIPIVKGAPDARRAAIFALVCFVAAVTLPAWRHVRVEYADDDPSRRPTLVRAIVDSLDRSSRSLAFWAGYLAFLFVAVVSPGSGPRSEVAWVGPAMAAIASIALAIALTSVVRWKLAETGVEREIFVRSTAIAFFATMVATAAYSLFEELADAPRLAMCTPWVFGIAVWAASGLVLRRMAS